VSAGAGVPGHGDIAGVRASEDEALEALGREWGGTYDIGSRGGRFYARRSDGTGGVLEGDTPDELDAAIRADRAAEGTP
jgi:hypothetical protein